MNPTSPEHKENAEMKRWKCDKCGDMIPMQFNRCSCVDGDIRRPAPVVAESAIQEAGKVEERLWDTRDIESLSLKCQLAKANAALLQLRAENTVKDEALKKAFTELNNAILTTEEIVAEEVLSGNIVKENCYKGHLSALRYAKGILEWVATPAASSRDMIEEMERLKAALTMAGGNLTWIKEVAQGLMIGEFETSTIPNQLEGIIRHCDAALNPQKKGDKL